MATERIVIPGIVKNGMVVPQNDTPLPDGAHVDDLGDPRLKGTLHDVACALHVRLREDAVVRFPERVDPCEVDDPLAPRHATENGGPVVDIPRDKCGPQLFQVFGRRAHLPDQAGQVVSAAGEPSGQVAPDEPAGRRAGEKHSA